MYKKIFNISVLTFVLLLSLTASGQKFSKKCKTCGKTITQCQYKGVHPQQSEPVRPVRQETPVYKPNNSIQYHDNGDITFVVDDVSFKMVKVESGTFQMGATSEQGSDAYGDETPVHSVSVDDYHICQTEVTQALWQAVMGNNPSYDRGSNKPVEHVSWDDCQEFIKNLNRKTGREFRLFRLPTEAEWEYAARGGKKSRGYKYSGSNNLGSVAWYDNNSNSMIHDVATKQPNELGLYDMNGNVWEWCQDRMGKYSSEAQNNPIGDASGANLVNRGGGAKTVDKSCRISVRMGDKAFTKGGYLGLRLAMGKRPIPSGGSAGNNSATTLSNISSAGNNRGYREQKHTFSVSGDVYTVDGVSFSMQYVSGGTFKMGATSEHKKYAYDDEKPVHKVTIYSFYIGRTEVTQALWEAVMGSNPSKFKGKNRPVESVSWDDCQEFINKLNKITGKKFRLPTEAEWEFAARGGVQSNGFIYSGGISGVWYKDNSNNETQVVARRNPNPLFLYDMSGNVMEWCQDWYGEYSSKHQYNYRGPSSGTYRVARGGCYIAEILDCRVSSRFRGESSLKSDFLGLRLVQ